MDMAVTEPVSSAGTTLTLGLSLTVDLPLRIMFQAELSLIYEIARRMKRAEPAGVDDAVEYCKEFLNMVYGDAVSAYNRANGEKLRFSVIKWLCQGLPDLSGSIRISRGMNGNGTGTLRARKEIYSKFLKNCNVYAGISVKSDSIINSFVSSNGTVEALTGRGVVVGSTIVAFTSISARTIGTIQTIVRDRIDSCFFMLDGGEIIDKRHTC